ncbi:hypothetical protein ACG04Q_25000 [Roseateles sp. DXS20W]|uniref:Uncharacterized protein n=1 Tax=Pelomonas lactea TaxID=3299030 RepID=A0ABW7GSF2_9BURK
MVATLLAPPRDELVLPAGDGLLFVDAANGEVVTGGLRCRLVQRRDGRLLGVARSTPGGAHHWPDLADRWRTAPAAPVQADVVVSDELQRFLPLSLPWPLPAAPAGQVVAGTLLQGQRLLRVNLLSAPGRPAPPGLASVYGLLAWQLDGAPAAWARVSYLTGDGRVVDGATDADGRLALHLPRPRPDRPGSPPGPAAQLRVFADRALAAASAALAAPDVLAFAAQPEVSALADVGAATAYAPPAFITGEPLILASLGLPPAQRELRLVPI